MTTTDDLDERLEAMFAAQAEALAVPDREWRDLRPAPARRPVARARRLGIIGVAAFAAILTVVAVPKLSNDDAVLDTGQSPSSVPAPSVPAPVPVAPILFETKQVSLRAQAMTIEVGGKQFVTTAPMEVSGDPGTPEYTTLELTWREHDVEMRMNIYFKSDGQQWWSDEIRTYDGKKQGDWTYYRGDFFRSPLGAAFTGDLDLKATGEEGSAPARLRLPGLQLEAFRRPAACIDPTGPYALQPSTDAVRLTMPGPGAESYGFTLVAPLLDTATCLPMAMPSGQKAQLWPAPAGFDYRWEAEHPLIVNVKPFGQRADLAATGAGSTVVRVTATRRASGAVVAEARVRVDISAPGTGPGAGGVIVPDAPPTPSP